MKKKHEDSKLDIQSLGTQTKAVHAGEPIDGLTQASSPNLVMSTTYVTDPKVAFSAEIPEDAAPYVYTRWANPTVAQLEEKLAILEQTESCLALASGMAAISTLFTYELQVGDHLIMSDIAYAGASELANDVLPRMGVEVSRVNMADLEELQAAFRPETKLIHMENPCNPICRLTDIEAVANIAKEKSIKTSVDATFASPMAMNAASLGVDYVIHSLTKYIGGHGDAIGGAVLGSFVDIEAMRQVSIRIGGILSPFNAWLIMRGAATLPIRMKAHEANALAVAAFLEAHPAVKQVTYAGLESHPQHELAKSQMANYSAMLTFQVHGDGQKVAEQLAEKLEIWHYAVSLGHHRSLIFYMNTSDLVGSSFLLSEAQEKAYRDFAGDGIFRVSVGLEDAEDLCADLEQALKL